MKRFKGLDKRLNSNVKILKGRFYQKDLRTELKFRVTLRKSKILKSK